jgi:hypothetical protein
MKSKRRRVMVPRAGIEPARPLGRRILSPLRLPIPPPRHFYEGDCSCVLSASKERL